MGVYVTIHPCMHECMVACLVTWMDVCKSICKYVHICTSARVGRLMNVWEMYIP